jgi:hypothetical protein
MILKIKKSYKIYSSIYRLMGDSNFMQFHNRLIVHQKQSNYNRYKLYEISMVLMMYQTIMKLHEIESQSIYK